MKLLVEIGLEEIPARLIKKAIKEFGDLFKKDLKENRIDFEDVKLYSTPRRLAIIINNISNIQKDLNEVKIGPAYSLCYKDNELTNIGQKFLQSQNAIEKNIEIVENEKGKYISIKKYEKGKYTKELLPNIIENILNKMTFEKTMKWGSSSFKFIRPIKWILVVLNNETLKFNFNDIKSSNITRGMRVVGSQNIEIKDIDDYEKLLEKNYVIVDRNKRQEMLLESIYKNCDTEDQKTIINKNLLEEVTDLVEYPFAIKGEFNKKYLMLPEELITITMETHQKYFSMKENNKLLNTFILIRNGYDNSNKVKIGNEKVIEPRLSDAKFFFDEDIKIPLINNLEKLKKVIFQKDMGTIYDKIQRMHKIADYLINIFKLEKYKNDIHKTIDLCKADLVSNVINEKEFTKLQGYMGSIYAEKQGYNKEICQGIKEHYRPFSFDEKLTSITGKITSLSDKLDTLIGCFCVSIIPTSSKDPFALRRACVGIIAILRDINLPINYIDLIKYVIDIFGADKKILNNKAFDDLVELFEDRLINSFDREYKNNFIRLFIDNDKDISTLINKNDILINSISSDNIDNLLNLIKRISNIIENENKEKLNAKLFEDKYERNLYTFILQLEKLDNFKIFINHLVKNQDIILEYFDNVIVNVKDEKIRKNRIATLQLLNEKIKQFINL